MSRIKSEEWSFDEIRKSDERRGIRLETAGGSQQLIEAVQLALSRALDCGDVGLAIDSVDNLFAECRTTVQFKVDQELYDWFFAGRTGYRAQFWIGPDIGTDFNAQIVKTLSGVLSALPNSFAVRRIGVTVDQERVETDLGASDWTIDALHASLRSEASKIWICERLYKRGRVDDIWLATVGAATRDPKLIVPRWDIGTKEGLLAPYPSQEYSWFDLKGGFVDAHGNARQSNPQRERANTIHTRGWT